MSEFFMLTCISLLMIISPGPDFAMITRTSLGIGRQAGIGAAFGIALANLTHVLFNIFGLSVIIANSITLFTVLKVLGALYLIYIGVKGLGVKKNKIVLNKANEALALPGDMESKIGLQEGHQKSQPKFFKHGLTTGFLTCMLNPKAALFFLSFFSVILSPETPFIIQTLYGTWISVLALAWFIMVAIFFTHSTMSRILSGCKHWIERIAGGALVVLGARLLLTKA